MTSFAQSIDNWTRMSELRMEAVFKQAAQDAAEAVQTPKAKGGRMPVDTGYLRNSFAGAVNSFPSADGNTPFSMSPIIAAIIRARLGDRIVFGWSANYAVYMEAENAFVRANVQNWPQIVRGAVTTVRSQYR